MANVKDGELILCQGIKMDKEYENVLSYSTSDMVTLCRNNKIATSSNYSILDPTVNEISVALPYSSCIYANYIAFKNPHNGNKWYFGFVNKVKFENPNVTTIEYQVDVFSTWYPSFSIGKAFIEREHVSDDTFGKHTIPEGLDTGEFVINGVNTFDQYANDFYVVAGVSKLPKEIASLNISSSSYPSRIYNCVYSGLTYIVFYTYESATKFTIVMDGQGLGDNIYDMFMIPKSIVTILNNEWVTTPCEATITIPALPDWSITVDYDINYKILPNSTTEQVMNAGETITRNTTLNGYTPKNNKMFTGEFNYMYVTNNAGADAKYNYEDFYNNTPVFSLLGAVTPGCSIRLIPKNYKLLNQSASQDYVCNPYGLTGAKYPVCSWSSDSYTNWLTQQSVNLRTEEITTAVSTVGLATIGNPAAAFGAFNLIQDEMATKQRREFAPVQAKGNLNSGDVTWAMGWNQFVLFKMSCRYEYAKICDNYLSRFGYKVNEIKTPSLTSRTKFNYIKVGGMDELVSGNIPASDLEEINRIFRKGVTIFHDYSTFGDYTQTNAIVTP